MSIGDVTITVAGNLTADPELRFSQVPREFAITEGCVHSNLRGVSLEPWCQALGSSRSEELLGLDVKVRIMCVGDGLGMAPAPFHDSVGHSVKELVIGHRVVGVAQDVQIGV